MLDGSDPAPGPVHDPTDKGGKLLRLRTRQKHAEVEGMEEAAVPQPALLPDEGAVHHRDLPGGAAEGEKRNARPGAGGLTERGVARPRDGGSSADCRAWLAPGWNVTHGAALALALGQLCVSSVASRA